MVCTMDRRRKNKSIKASFYKLVSYETSVPLENKVMYRGVHLDHQVKSKSGLISTLVFASV